MALLPWVTYPTDPAPFSTFALTPGMPFRADLPSGYWVLTNAPDVSELLTLVEREIEVRRRAESVVARRVGGVPLGTSLLDSATPAEIAEVRQLERGIATAMERCRWLSNRSSRER